MKNDSNWTRKFRTSDYQILQFLNHFKLARKITLDEMIRCEFSKKQKQILVRIFERMKKLNMLKIEENRVLFLKKDFYIQKIGRVY